MSRYIDADALYEVVTEKYYDIGAGSYPYNIVAYDMAKLVKNAPAADVVEVVRCKDCIHSSDYGKICHYSVGRDVSPDHYCGYGERSENGKS